MLVMYSCPALMDRERLQEKMYIDVFEHLLRALCIR